MQQLENQLNLEEKQVCGLVCVNSIDFVKTVFDCFNKNQIVVFLRHADDRDKIEATGASQMMTPQLDFGWW